MKADQLPNMPPEVKAARDVLAAWLNVQKAERGRRLKEYDDGGLIFGDRGQVIREDAADLLFNQEQALLALTRPDLSQAERLVAAVALVDFCTWHRGRMPEERTNRKWPLSYDVLPWLYARDPRPLEMRKHILESVAQFSRLLDCRDDVLRDYSRRMLIDCKRAIEAALNETDENRQPPTRPGR